jgi:hypothetical protein
LERFAAPLASLPPRFFFLPLSLADRAATLSRMDAMAAGCRAQCAASSVRSAGDRAAIRRPGLDFLLISLYLDHYGCLVSYAQRFSKLAESRGMLACRDTLGIRAQQICVLVQPDGWAGEREGYGARDVTSLSLRAGGVRGPRDVTSLSLRAGN